MPTPQTAVVTPTRLLPQRLPYLQALHDSLKAQRDITWQWILSLDGASPDNIPIDITRDPRVKILPLPKCGAAMARNLAMNIVDAPTLVFSDDDDILTDTSLAVRYEHLVANETASWVAGQIHNLHDDGNTKPRESPVPIGWQPAGAVWRHVQSPTQPVPLGHTALMVTTQYALSLGGHGGLTQGEDYVFTAAATGRAPGIVIPEVVYLYRDHSNGQMTKESTYSALELCVRRFVMNQAAAIANLHPAQTERLAVITQQSRARTAAASDLATLPHEQQDRDPRQPLSPAAQHQPVTRTH